MQSRRTFLQISALSVAGTALSTDSLSFLAPPPSVRHLGVQLYSVREVLNKDPAGTLQALAKMGYREVEGFGEQAGKIGGVSLPDFSKMLKDSGLSMPSSHFNLKLADWDDSKNTLTDATKKALDAAAATGQKYIVNPWMDVSERGEIVKLIKLFNAAGEYINKAGLRFAYHNHEFEYVKKGPDNRLLIEWLLHEIDPKVMAMEMDLYWVCFAGYNPLDWFRLYPGRWELCHAKDMAKTEKRETVEVGDGSIDFASIFKQGKLAGLQYHIVELEHYKTTPMEGVKRARENFLKLKF